MLPYLRRVPPRPRRCRKPSTTKTTIRQPRKIIHFLPGLPGSFGSSDAGSTGPSSVSAVTVCLPPVRTVCLAPSLHAMDSPKKPRTHRIPNASMWSTIRDYRQAITNGQPRPVAPLSCDS